MEMTELEDGNTQVILTPDETEFMLRAVIYFKDNRSRILKLTLDNMGLPAVD